MEELLTKTKSLLSAKFPGSADELAERLPGRRIGGAFVWSGFEGMAQIDRQDLVREALNKGLTREEERLVGLLLTFTPHEVAMMEEYALEEHAVAA